MEIKNYIFAGFPALAVESPEEERVMAEFQEIAKMYSMNFAWWRETSGISIFDRRRGSFILQKEELPPHKVLEKGLDLNDGDKGLIFCLLDFHPFFKNSRTWRTAKDAFRVAQKHRIIFVFISAKIELIPELEHEVVKLALPFPTMEELQHLARNLADNQNPPLQVTDEEVRAAAEAARGLTLVEAEGALAAAYATCGNYDVPTILQMKKQMICEGGILEYIPPKTTAVEVGGLENYMSWARKRLAAFSPEAQKFGLPYPHGVLLLGIPGCGKSLTAKAMATLWGKPLLKLDVGKLFGSLVGDTEANTRRALEMAEAMSPAILWLDEIEKGLSGIQSSGRTDSGVTSRMFGTILTWMQEKKEPVFVVATANNIASLPSELLRKGRFDEIFFVDLPDLEERESIFEIQIRKYKRNPADFDLKALAKKSANYTGAEIEEAVVSALFDAWNDGAKELTTEAIIRSLEEMSPAADGIMFETVRALREFAKGHNIRYATERSYNAKCGHDVRQMTYVGGKGQ